VLSSRPGVHFALSDGDFPPRKNDTFPLCVSVHCIISARCAVHFLYRKRKCSTDSVACPHAHSCDDAAVIRKRYPFSLAMPVLSCASILASFHDKPSYSCRVCLPGNAVLTFFENFPTLSGRCVLISWLNRAMLRVVDRILGNFLAGIEPF
jgi:hypothetical protein